jgi:hypothetical protein
LRRSICNCASAKIETSDIADHFDARVKNAARGLFGHFFIVLASVRGWP